MKYWTGLKTPSRERRKCSSCNRRVTMRQGKFIYHPIYPNGITFCGGSGYVPCEVRPNLD